MKIVKLVAENVKRLHAVSITPDGTLITVGGKNGAGKSSVLDSIAYAMGGEKLVPTEPIRAGEAEARIVVDLGDLVVTRKFQRSKTRTCDAGQDHKEIGHVCHVEYGDTTSTLTVTNKDGARYPSPQAVLDKMLGKLTFDPLAFARADVKEQDKILRALVGLDITPIEARRKEAFDRRAMLKKTLAIKEAQLAALPFHKDAPKAEVPITTARLKQAEEYRKLADEAERAVEKRQTNIVVLQRNIEERNSSIAQLKRQLQEAEDALTLVYKNLKDDQADLDALQITAQAARAVVPDMGVISAEMAATEQMNVKVRANQRHAELFAETEALLHDQQAQDDAVKQAEQEKKDALAAAQFPVPGLGLSDDGVTFNNVPFNQAGSAEQIRVSVAIGIALNPKLKVLLIRNGNLLDGNSLAAVAAQAAAADMQVWMEYVSETADGVAVMLVDGEVA